MVHREPVPRPYELLMLGLSVYVLAALAADAAFSLTPATREILGYVDAGICMIFLAEFCVNLARAEDRLGFLKWGWIDLVSSIPTLDAARAGRALRVVRILRVLRGVRSLKRLGGFLLCRRAESALSAAVLLSILLISFAGIAVLELEADHPDALIRTAPDALWWAVCTVTTVGYGDVYPVTMEGRVVAVLLMTGGVACFGTFTAFVASWFLAPAQKPAGDLAHIQNQLDALVLMMGTLRASPSHTAGLPSAIDADPCGSRAGLA